MRLLLLVVAIAGMSVLPARAVERKAIDDAIARGLAGLKEMQQPDGTWNHTQIGATALAGLTLVECGVAKSDKVVTVAATKVREAGYGTRSTYSLALSILFLDSLDDPNDTPLIESMIVRLLAGQNAKGSWSYGCPGISDEEIRRLKAESSGRLLKVGRDLTKLPPRGKRTVKDVAPEIQTQLGVVGRVPLGMGVDRGDNSNTQFAILGLWVGRRYGIPTQAALIKADTYFRAIQDRRSTGMWPYFPIFGTIGPGRPDNPGTPTMTCAGVMALAFGNGAQHDVRQAKDPKAKPRDISGDAKLKFGLKALTKTVGSPVDWDGQGVAPRGIAPISGKGYYYLWSVERVAVALNLETIGKKKWYDWGAEMLLANQNAHGTWTNGEFAGSGADTCFALLFLRRANLARDLSASIVGMTDPGKVLRAGGIGGDTLKASPSNLGEVGIGKTPGSEEKKPSTGGSKVVGAGKKPAEKTPDKSSGTAAEKAAGRLGADLLEATAERRADILKQMRDQPGVAYTEALVESISRLDGEARKEARIALAERLTRMKPATLREYLKDEEAEIRRAATLATAARRNKEHVPDLIRLLSDPESLVRRAARHSLKKLTGEDFGPDEEATVSQRKAAIAAWLKWWQAQSRE